MPEFETGAPHDATSLDALVNHMQMAGAFGASERRVALLRYLLKEELEGRGGDIKAVRIAIDVLDRDESFDSSQDSIVRVEVARLREALDLFYARDAAPEMPVITIPKGTYRPVIAYPLPPEQEQAPNAEVSTPPKADSTQTATDGAMSGTAPPTPTDGQPKHQGRPRRRLRRVTQMLAAAAVSAAATYVVLERPWAAPTPLEAAQSLAQIRGPKIAVASFLDTDASPQEQFIGAGIGSDIVRELARFSWLTVFSKTDAPSPEALATAGPELAGGVDYILYGRVVVLANRLRVVTQLVAADGGAVLWSDSVDTVFSADDIFRVQTDIAEKIAVTIGRPDGLVTRLDERRVARDTTRSLDAYKCLLKTYRYWRTLSSDSHFETRTCLEFARSLDPAYAEIRAALAFLYLDEVRYGLNRSEDYDAMERAEEEARRAYELDPLSTLAAQALFTIAVQKGDYATFRRIAERAVRHAANDPELLADFGNKLALNFGRWDEGVELALLALGMNPDPPGHYYFAIVWEAVLERACEDALAYMRRVGGQGHFLFRSARLACLAEVDAEDVLAIQVRRMRADGYGNAADVLAALAESNLHASLLSNVAPSLQRAYGESTAN